jgi:hypothetical protein
MECDGMGESLVSRASYAPWHSDRVSLPQIQDWAKPGPGYGGRFENPDDFETVGSDLLYISRVPAALASVLKVLTWPQIKSRLWYHKA